MSHRRTDVLLVAVLLASLLGVFLFLFLRRPPIVAASADPPVVGLPSRPNATCAALPEPTGESKDVPGPRPEAGVVSGSAGPGRGGEDPEVGARPPPRPAWKSRPSVEFSEKDAELFGQGVTLELGSYNARTGQEFEVSVALTSPALESCTLVVGYDPVFLAIVPGSAEPVGQGFRAGIECYADEAGGRLVLIHQGTPGSKNLDATSGGVVAVWRMRALQRGRTRLTVQQETSFENGTGKAEELTVAGGGVTIR